MDKVKFTNGVVLRGALYFGVGIYKGYLFFEALGRDGIVGEVESDKLVLAPNVKWIKPAGKPKQRNRR